MRPRTLGWLGFGAGALALSLSSSVAAAEAVPRAIVEVVHATDGSPCVDLKLSALGETVSEVLSDVCHGWSTFRCNGNLFVNIHPVVQADAVVLLPRERTHLHLTGFIDREIRLRWPGDELDHLEFGRASCVGGVLSVPFSGSHVPAGGGGGKGLLGTASLTSTSTLAIQLQAAPPQ